MIDDLKNYRAPLDVSALLDEGLAYSAFVGLLTLALLVLAW